LKIFIWTVSVLLLLVIAGLAFVYFSPDYDMYVVRSGSMTPAVEVGDMVITGPASGPFGGGIKPGTIVTYARGKELITHRIVSLENGILVTKGDASEDPDAQPVQMTQVVGVYLFKIPKLGYVSSFIHTKPGWLLVIILPTAALVGLIIKEIINEALRDDDDDARRYAQLKRYWPNP
jgi:signal peptidase